MKTQVTLKYKLANDWNDNLGTVQATVLSDNNSFSQAETIIKEKLSKRFPQAVNFDFNHVSKQIRVDFE